MLFSSDWYSKFAILIYIKSCQPIPTKSFDRVPSPAVKLLRIKREYHYCWRCVLDTVLNLCRFFRFDCLIEVCGAHGIALHHFFPSALLEVAQTVVQLGCISLWSSINFFLSSSLFKFLCDIAHTLSETSLRRRALIVNERLKMMTKKSASECNSL